MPMLTVIHPTKALGLGSTQGLPTHQLDNALVVLLRGLSGCLVCELPQAAGSPHIQAGCCWLVLSF